MGKLMLNDRCYTGSDNLLILNDESYSGGQFIPTTFRYLKWHITANGGAEYMQVSEMGFEDDNGNKFVMPTGYTATSSLPPFVPADDVYVLFDGSMNTKIVLQWTIGTSVEDITIDFGANNYLDVTEYPYFYWCSSDDDYSYYGRPPRIWTLYGANKADFSDAVILDDALVPINRENKIVAYKAKMALNINIRGNIDYLESWIINSQTSIPIPTTTTHIQYTDGVISAFDVCQNQGDATITMGDITTFIGSASSWLWRVTANNDMTYRLYDVLTGTLGELQTAQSGDVIIDDGITGTAYCVEIRRYS